MLGIRPILPHFLPPLAIIISVHRVQKTNSVFYLYLQYSSVLDFTIFDINICHPVFSTTAFKRLATRVH